MIPGIILTDTIDFFLQLTRHLLHPSELTFSEWGFLICSGILFLIFAVLYWKAISKELDKPVRRINGRLPWW